MAELNRGPGTDPRAVRVGLDESSRAGGVETYLRVAPALEPLQMTNPTVGTGPLGGLAISGEHEPVTVRAQRQVLVDGEPIEADLHPMGSGRYLLEEGTNRTRVVIEPATTSASGTRLREVLVDGYRIVVKIESERIAALRERATSGRATSGHAGPLQVRAIIPGKVVSVSVKAGDAVTAGQQLLAVEAMKMQNELRAPRDGTIERVGVAVGVNIELGDLLVVIS